jgi:hypothetical protein
MKHSKANVFMVAILSVAFFLSLSVHSVYGQWAATYGGSGMDLATSILQTADGGYVVTGGTRSFGVGDYDFWVMKLDSNGAITWQKTYGGEGYDYATSIQQTADGGYIVAGKTESFGSDNCDVWVLKLDSAGVVTWQKRYGGAEVDTAQSIQQTADGGYIVAGYTFSFGSGDNDGWILKLDGDGNVTWQKTYGNVNVDWIYSIQQTADGGYIVAGEARPFGSGGYHGWILKLDGDGNVTWQKAYGTGSPHSTFAIRQTPDNGYIVTGGAYTSGTGSTDVWVMKLDSTGAVTWQKTYGGTNYDYAYSIQQTTDGGYIVVGETYSFGQGNYSIWLIRLDAGGAIMWQKTFGGTAYQRALSAQQTQDGGYMVAGWHQSSIASVSDAFILKLDSSGSAGLCPFEGASTVVAADTAVTGVDSTVVPADTSVTGVDTTATVSDSSASANQWCPLMEDSQRLKVGITPKKKGEGTIQSAEGLIACPDTCQQEYNKALTVTLYADPSGLSTFLGWKPAPLGCEGTDPCTVTMDKKKSVKAVFQGPNKLKVVTTFKKEATGTVTSCDTLINCPGDCEELYILNAPVTLTAAAGDGSNFVKWTGRPCKDELTNVCTFTMDKNATVKAIFQPNPE